MACWVHVVSLILVAVVVAPVQSTEGKLEYYFKCPIDQKVIELKGGRQPDLYCWLEDGYSRDFYRLLADNGRQGNQVKIKTVDCNCHWFTGCDDCKCVEKVDMVSIEYCGDRINPWLKNPEYNNMKPHGSDGKPYGKQYGWNRWTPNSYGEYYDVPYEHYYCWTSETEMKKYAKQIGTCDVQHRYSEYGTGEDEHWCTYRQTYARTRSDRIPNKNCE